MKVSNDPSVPTLVNHYWYYTTHLEWDVPVVTIKSIGHKNTAAQRFVASIKAKDNPNFEADAAMIVEAHNSGKPIGKGWEAVHHGTSMSLFSPDQRKVCSIWEENNPRLDDDFNGIINGAQPQGTKPASPELMRQVRYAEKMLKANWGKSKSDPTYGIQIPWIIQDSAENRNDFVQVMTRSGWNSYVAFESFRNLDAPLGDTPMFVTADLKTVTDPIIATPAEIRNGRREISFTLDGAGKTGSSIAKPELGKAQPNQATPPPTSPDID